LRKIILFINKNPPKTLASNPLQHFVALTVYKSEHAQNSAFLSSSNQIGANIKQTILYKISKRMINSYKF